jgi:hypothetical protein
MFALMSRDVRVVLVAAAGLAGASPALRAMFLTWMG